MKKYILLVALTCAALFGSAQNGLFWKITPPKGKPSYLFGTFHLTNSSFLDKHPQVVERFNETETVVLELLQEQGIESAMLKYAFSRDSSLQEVLNPEDYAFVMERLELYLGNAAGAMNMFKPLMASLMVSAAIAREETPDSLFFEGTALEKYLEEQAKEKGMATRGLESAEEQAELLLTEQTEGQQARELLDMLRNEETVRQETRKLVVYYFQDNLDSLEVLGKEMEAQYGSMDGLLKDRNLKWLPVLKKQMKKGPTFVAVGALHLAGPYGLLELLRKEGFTLEAIPLANK